MSHWNLSFLEDQLGKSAAPPNSSCYNPEILAMLKKTGLRENVKSDCEKTLTPTQDPFYKTMTLFSQQISGEREKKGMEKIFRIAT